MNSHNYFIMFLIMLFSGLLSTMNVWVDKIDDIRFSINDFYMTLLMTGWMFFFMGIVDYNINIILLGISLIIINIWFIRTQFMVNTRQFILGMIPHHSMAIHMSKKLLNNDPSILSTFSKNIIKQQEKEIQFMKTLY